MKKETETQNKPQSKGKMVMMKVINTVINILIVIVLIVSLLIAVLALTSKANGISTVFGYTIQPIQTDSMKGGSPDGYPSGDFESGDLMIAKSTDFDFQAEYELGDIVTFTSKDDDGNQKLIVHRIVDIIKTDEGLLTYQTQGDNRFVASLPDQEIPAQYITAGRIGSVYYSKNYEGKILKGWGKVLDFLQSQLGFFLVILLPMIIFFLYELIRVILNFNNYKKSKADEEKEQAVKEAVAAAVASTSNPENLTPEQMEQFKKFLEQQNAQKESAEIPAEETSSETAESSEE